MKKIALNSAYQTKNTGKYFALVDDEDFEWLNLCSWTLRQKRGNAVNSNGQSLHHLIMRVKDKQIIDHIDGNPLNNQKSNLRIVNQRQNTWNRIKMKNTSSKFKGVYWNKPLKCWYAQIRINGKRKSIGLFKNEISAGVAYDFWATYLFGEFAKTNFKIIAHSPGIVLAD